MENLQFELKAKRLVLRNLQRRSRYDVINNKRAGHFDMTGDTMRWLYVVTLLIATGFKLQLSVFAVRSK